MIKEKILDALATHYKSSCNDLLARYIIIHSKTYEKFLEEEKVFMLLTNTPKGASKFAGVKFVRTEDIHQDEIIIV
jgi:hypothetical protein